MPDNIPRFLLYLELYTGSGIFQFRIFESLPDESIGNRRMDDFEDRDPLEDLDMLGHARIMLG